MVLLFEKIMNPREQIYVFSTGLPFVVYYKRHGKEADNSLSIIELMSAEDMDSVQVRIAMFGVGVG